ncbi:MULTISPECIES: hypothetical protein [Rhodococcus]|jgi:hypothetical protein|uniref:hypothetical protein n=1 Tax=Rhodococcus TaxID=1827 RepID=UPI00069A00FA|nr:hypothetical protein [Rhodococcus qingshengii]KSU66281.1 hypothetical protein AS032_32210 [Rhodococcus qingshengii]NHP18403.1 hypothetical protein [Rhodococcus sp. IC4_135]SCC69848.1 hypothetical protein GA0061093_13041 [Rhodococcus qingshengii]
MRFVHARADDLMCTCGFRVQSDDEFDRHLDERRVSAAVDQEDVAACEQLSSMLDSLEKARAEIGDARAVLRALYDGPTSSRDVENFLAVEAEDQDIVAHLAAAERSLRATRSIVRSHLNDLTHPGTSAREGEHAPGTNTAHSSRPAAMSIRTHSEATDLSTRRTAAPFNALRRQARNEEGQ